jgi:hypothetical protein
MQKPNSVFGNIQNIAGPDYGVVTVLHNYTFYDISLNFFFLHDY